MTENDEIAESINKTPTVRKVRPRQSLKERGLKLLKKAEKETGIGKAIKREAIKRARKKALDVVFRRKARRPRPRVVIREKRVPAPPRQQRVREVVERAPVSRRPTGQTFFAPEKKKGIRFF